MERVLLAIALLTAGLNAENSTLSHDAGASDTCGAIGFGPWSQALEDWVTSAHSDRHGRIMALPSSKGYYVTERIDAPYLSPPPPHHSPHPHVSSNYGHGPPNQGQYPSNQGYMGANQSPPQGHIPLTPSHASGQGPTPLGKGPKPPGKAPQFAEWAHAPPGAGKIVNRPPADRPQPGHALDRVDEPPRKHVSETDLFLLSAIEKLVYRADLMEKRLRAVEDGLHHLLAQPAPAAGHEECPAPFARVGAACVSVRRAPRDWKRAAQDCRAMRAALVELRAADQRRALLAHLTSADKQNGADYWTGGLNPGLLWIWSHSARPLTADDNSVGGNQTVSVAGGGRCLALVWDAARRAHVYRGRDCADELRYVCERLPDAEPAPAPATRDAGPAHAAAPAPASASAAAPATNATAAAST
ncbi:uncharacterized protein LOC124536106 [Vanessa cardui]|uniref:uncharacterized protein LOC124536106 n=1 Tax=Vanessa cardui TaxID=171605 RepID=UPI001F1386A1|nr:uncharacterized protein LOC124536106 [Vanessa cardui]